MVFRQFPAPSWSCVQPKQPHLALQPWNRACHQGRLHTGRIAVFEQYEANAHFLWCLLQLWYANEVAASVPGS